MRKIIIIVSVIILFIFLAVTGAYVFISKEVKEPFKSGGEESVFEIKEGEGIRDISQSLAKSGLIKNAPYFLFWSLKEGKQDKILPGLYCLSSSMSIVEVINKISLEENAIAPHIKLTFPEGWQISQIEERLRAKNLLGLGAIFALKIEDFNEAYKFLSDASKGNNLEGYLFPDTYFFDCQDPEIFCDKGEGEIKKCRKDDVKEIIFKFLDNFNEKLTDDLRMEIKKQKKSIFEIVTMASLLEKEVRTREDKELVAGILWKRLEEGIPLQVDATINYILGGKSTVISIENTKIDSPYNTYKYRGLPSGPISNPGLESIEAAVSPEESDYYYYLSDPKTGKTVFSKSFEEHNQSKQKYLR
ncbi:MAG: endolytic transglycosylase MltG [Patescibacteria group bacterium]